MSTLSYSAPLGNNWGPFTVLGAESWGRGVGTFCVLIMENLVVGENMGPSLDASHKVYLRNIAGLVRYLNNGDSIFQKVWYFGPFSVVF